MADEARGLGLLKSTLLSVYIGYLIVSVVPFFYGVFRPPSLLLGLNQCPEQAVAEIEIVRKILIVVSPILAIAAIFEITTYPIIYSPLYFSPIVPIAFEILIVGIGIFFMYFGLFGGKESRFYFSKSYFRVARIKKDLNQMYYFGLGLVEYNKYIKRNLKHQIKEIDKIYSKAIVLDNDKRTEIISSLSDGFETEADRLKPLRTISTELMKSEDAENVLIPESLKSKLKAIGAFLGASIPIVISIITLYLTLTGHKP